jgi:circadian clock protein KaiB
MRIIKKTPLARPRKATLRTPEVFKLRLYVAGQTPKSIRAFANLKVLCDEHLKGRYQIEVIDLLEHPDMARGDQIVAIPAGHQAAQPVGRSWRLVNTDRVLVGHNPATGQLIPQNPYEEDPEKDRPHSRQARYVLRLYVSRSTLKSKRAIENMKRVCEEHLNGRYNLEVIDIYEHANLARDEQIVAVPTLIKQLPLPLRRLVGDMSDLNRVLFGLDLRTISTGSL